MPEDPLMKTDLTSFAINNLRLWFARHARLIYYEFLSPQALYPPSKRDLPELRLRERDNSAESCLEKGLLGLMRRRKERERERREREGGEREEPGITICVCLSYSAEKRRRSKP